MKIKEGDTVRIVTGADRGETGKVLKVLPIKDKVIVEGVARVWKHVRRSQKNPQGGRLQKEMPVHVSNVQVICPQTGKPTKVGYRYREDGSKEQFREVSGASLGVISPARPAYAKKS